MKIHIVYYKEFLLLYTSSPFYQFAFYWVEKTEFQSRLLDSEYLLMVGKEKHYRTIFGQTKVMYALMMSPITGYVDEDAHSNYYWLMLPQHLSVENVNTKMWSEPESVFGLL